MRTTKAQLEEKNTELADKNWKLESDSNRQNQTISDLKGDIIKLKEEKIQTAKDENNYLKGLIQRFTRKPRKVTRKDQNVTEIDGWDEDREIGGNEGYQHNNY